MPKEGERPYCKGNKPSFLSTEGHFSRKVLRAEAASRRKGGKILDLRRRSLWRGRRNRGLLTGRRIEHLEKKMYRGGSFDSAPIDYERASLGSMQRDLKSKGH